MNDNVRLDMYTGRKREYSFRNVSRRHKIGDVEQDEEQTRDENETKSESKLAI